MSVRAHEPAEARIIRSLGLDPDETAAQSLTIAPLAEGFIVKWQGVKILSRDEVLAALGGREALAAAWDAGEIAGDENSTGAGVTNPYRDTPDWDAMIGG